MTLVVIFFDITDVIRKTNKIKMNNHLNTRAADIVIILCILQTTMSNEIYQNNVEFFEKSQLKLKIKMLKATKIISMWLVPDNWWLTSIY
jgi:hypothetical protein